MVYSKTSFRPTRWVVAVPHDSPVKKIEDLKGKRISTEMVNFTKRYFAERNIPVEVEFSWGATEAKAAEGLVDAHRRSYRNRHAPSAPPACTSFMS